MYDVKLSLIVPCFNEGKIIYNNLKTIFEYLQKTVTSFEVIAVNDGSQDNTFRSFSARPVNFLCESSAAGSTMEKEEQFGMDFWSAKTIL